MKLIKLKKLTLRNFKGIKNFELITDGNTQVYGDNATGKTTLFDAFTWLLFDKDSRGKKEFSIKTISNNEIVNNLEHEVSAIFDGTDGQTELKKIYKEKYTRKRGSATAELQGHESKYYVDGVPKKKGEYEDAVKLLISEDIFKLLTSPLFFNEQLDWKKRRNILLDVCGGISDDYVMDSSEELKELKTLLGNKTIEDYQKIIVSQKTKVNGDLQDIPVRIDEVTRQIPDVSELSKDSLEEKINLIDSQINEKQKEIANVKSGFAIAEKEKQIIELDGELINRKRQIENNSIENRHKFKMRLQTYEGDLSNFKYSKKRKEIEIKDLKRSIEQKEELQVKLRSQWQTINEEEFSFIAKSECPTCGQALPIEQVEQASHKALADFNLSKSAKLEEITKNGIFQKNSIEKLKESIVALEKEIDKFNKFIIDKEIEIEKVKKELVEIDVPDVAQDAEYSRKLRDKKDLQVDLATLNSDANMTIASLNNELTALQDDRRTLINDLQQFDALEHLKKRQAELEAEQKALGAEYEELERRLYLIELFTKTKVGLLTDKINGKFKIARFKLFDEQINGGIKECCETVVDGVPFGTGLNNAMRINVGLDIINTLTEHYRVSAPIFVDNAESVTDLIATTGQLISLIVSADDKKMRVEAV